MRFESRQESITRFYRNIRRTLLDQEDAFLGIEMSRSEEYFNITCRCEHRNVPWNGSPILTVSNIGCPLHAPELYVEYLAERFERGPLQLEIEMDAAQPDRYRLTVDGKTKTLSQADALRWYACAQAVMESQRP